jgi:four helix bundle protein
MTYRNFEDLPVWQAAASLYEAVEELLRDERFVASRGFRDQLDRAALSVSNNIAEGFERGTSNELLAFIYIARGSAGETRSMLRLKCRKLANASLRQKVDALVATAESCSRQLGGWAESVKNSGIKGIRHLTEQDRRENEQGKRAEACKKELLMRLPATHPLRKDAEARGLI